MDKTNVLFFAPQYWGELEKFCRFFFNTYSLSILGRSAVFGAQNHFYKAKVLKDLAVKLAPNLEIDQAELEAEGYTPAKNRQELAAVIEGIIIELYSSVDCTCTVLYEIFKNYRGVPKSTRKFFQKAQNGKIDPKFPVVIYQVFATADWYKELREYRDELTHGNIGQCYKSGKMDKVSYMHFGLEGIGRKLSVDDIFRKLREFAEHIDHFSGVVFQYLNQQLKDEEMSQICCVIEGYIYTRLVLPQEAVDFDSGRCEAYKWFEKKKEMMCPHAKICGAYAKVANK